ncbi:MAG: response regulator [Nitrososphaeraceae archaeon]
MLTKAIAIVDDEADLVNLFSEALKLNSFKVCAFTNPLEALNHIEKNHEDYGLVISDFKMPIMNGNELCTKLININPNQSNTDVSIC